MAGSRHDKCRKVSAVHGGEEFAGSIELRLIVAERRDQAIGRAEWGVVFACHDEQRPGVFLAR